MTGDLTIREVRPDDAGGVVAIFNPIIEAGVYSVFDAPFTVEVERSYIQTLPQRAIFLVAERATDGVLVGFQSMEPFATYTQAFAHVGVLGTYVDCSATITFAGSRQLDLPVLGRSDELW